MRAIASQPLSVTMCWILFIPSQCFEDEQLIFEGFKNGEQVEN
jgi:hypothetical protein